MLKSPNKFQEVLDDISHLLIRSEQISKCQISHIWRVNNFEIC